VPPVATDPPHLDGVRHRFVDVAGLRVHVAEAGAGEPVLLQHGWPQHWWMWRFVIPPLAGRYRVICPDLRGHGWTDAPPGGYEKERLAADLLGLLDALELGRVRLLAHDWGAFAGFLACLRAPERFSHFLALSILHPWPTAERPDPRRLARLWYQAALAAPVVGQALVRRLAFVRRVLQGGRAAGRWTEDELELYAGRFREPARAQATVALYRSFLARELGPLLAGRYRDRSLSVPTRLVVGAADPVFAGDRLRGYEDHADDMEVEWLRGLGHFVPEEDPAAVSARALSFLGEGR
jgi:pimeloyl-ACP methyl ester carboxylesterase